MKYGITDGLASFSEFIEIAKDEYEQIEKARNNLFEGLFIEEKFDLVSENYYEFETELLSIASRMMIFKDDNYFSMSRERNTISRRIVNLMTACRMYLDSINHHLKSIYGKDLSKVNLIEKEKSNQYDKRIGYRVIEALRNHVQHCGFPIHNAKFSYERVQLENETRLSHIVMPILKVKTLEEDGEFKKSVLKELKSIDTKNGIDIRPFIRDYVEGIWEIHETTREIISSDLIIWKEIINNTIDRFQKKTDKDTSISSLTLFKANHKDHWINKTDIFQDYIKRIEDYQSKNSLFINLSIRYASNEIRKEDS